MKEKEYYESAMEFVAKATTKLEDKKQIEYYNRIISSMKEAASMAGDGSKEKPSDAEFHAILNDAAVRYANQIAFILFIDNKLDDELAADLRTLPSVDEVSSERKTHDNARNARIEEIKSEQQRIIDRQQQIDLFTAVIAGYSREEAESKMKAYAKQMSQQ